MRNDMKSKIVALWDKAKSEKCNPLWYYGYSELMKAYDDYKSHNGKLKECEEITRRIYTNIGNHIRKEEKLQKEQSVRNLIVLFGNQLDALLDEFGIGKAYGNSYRIKDLNKFFLYMYDNVIEPKIKELGIKGLKLKNRSRATPNVYELFDFSNVEFDTDEIESN
jgi:hypothetical protein